MYNPFKRCEKTAHSHRYIQTPRADMDFTVCNEETIRDLLRILATRTNITVNINYYQITGDITANNVSEINNIR